MRRAVSVFGVTTALNRRMPPGGGPAGPELRRLRCPSLPDGRSHSREPYFDDHVSQVPRHEHEAHRWLALAHGAAFLTSAVTGIIMMRAQDSDAETFASTARIHTASNVVLVPLLSVALSNILFE